MRLAELKRVLREYASESHPDWSRATIFVRSDRGETLEVVIYRERPGPDESVTSSSEAPSASPQ
jgi:hypothetical protein